MIARISKITFVLVAMVFLQGGSSRVIQPTAHDIWKKVPASEVTMKLDAHVKEYLRDQFSIDSAHYFQVPAKVPWGLVSKIVENEMADKSIQKIRFKWFNIGYHLVDVYPQGSNGAGFALAMIEGDFAGDEKHIGYYVLGAPETGK